MQSSPRWLVIAFALSLAACSRSERKPADKPAGTPAHKLVAAMCACTTPECIAQTRKSVAALTSALDEPGTLALEACARKADMHATATVVRRAEQRVDELCACKQDQACVDKASKALRETSQSVANFEDEAMKLPASEAGRYKRAEEKLQTCTGGAVALSHNPEVARIRGFAQRMCKCADVGCATEVHKEMTAWFSEHFKGANRKTTKKNVERWRAAQKVFTECYAKRMNPGQANPTP